MKFRFLNKYLVSLIILPLWSYAADLSLGFPFTTKYEVYVVEGDIESEIDTSFETQKPRFLKAREVDGYTGWVYDFWTNDNTCEIKEFSLEITYKLPQIRSSTKSPETTELYRDYIERLYRHEETHCALAVKSVNEMYLAFKKGQRGNCGKQNNRVSELVGKIVTDNELFDTYTNHGEIELAASPFSEESYYSICKIPFSGIAGSI